MSGPGGGPGAGRGPRVLVVDDEPQIHRFLAPALQLAGFEPQRAMTGAEGLRALATRAPDVVLLDLGLPDLDGREVLVRARAFYGGPILVLSARDREAEKIEALDAGADDYVEKPFAVGELLARLRVALRRVRPVPEATGPLRAGEIEIDLERRLVLRAGAPVRLSPKEFDLLAALARGRGRVVTHRQLLTSVWGARPRARSAVPARVHRPAAPSAGRRTRLTARDPDRARRRLPPAGGLTGATLACWREAASAAGGGSVHRFKAGLVLAGALIAGTATAQPVAEGDPGPTAPVQYDIAFANAQHHEAKVTATWRAVPSGPLKVQMSRSSPGRYAIHEFAKNVYSVSAVDGAGRPLRIDRQDPYSWTVVGHDGVVRVTYTLYADRGDGTYSQIDPTHAHLNMPATFMWAQGYDKQPIRVRFHKLDPKWTIATQLPAVADAPDVFWARDLQYFMDSPTELADLKWREWPVIDKGRTFTFRLALHDPGEAVDADAFVEKLKRLVPEHVKVFGELPQFDYGTYTFIADYMPQISGDGMEHRNSTFISQPRGLYQADFKQLDTASHEFVHAWNVKRIRPAELEPFDFTQADPTPSLWLAEGFTQYYGPLMVRRSGQSSIDEFLTATSGTLNAVLNRSGRTYGSPQEMSLRAPFMDAATSIDPTNGNTVTSYYPYGAVVALALDLTLRGQGKGLTLDDYMRTLWRTFGAPFRPYRPADLPAALGSLTGNRAFADAFFKANVEGSRLPDYRPLLDQAGLKLRPKPSKKGWLGAQRVRVNGPEVFLDEAPQPDTPLYTAGVDRGDRLLAIGRLTLESEADWQAALERFGPGATTTVKFIQRGRTREAPLRPAADPTLEVVRYEAAGLKPTAAQLAFRERWLGKDTGKTERAGSPGSKTAP